MRIFEIYQIDIHYYFAVSYHVLTLDRNILILFEATHKRKKGVCSDITNENQIICGFASVQQKILEDKKSPTPRVLRKSAKKSLKYMIENCAPLFQYNEYCTCVDHVISTTMNLFLFSDNTLYFWKYPEDEGKRAPSEQISLHNVVTETPVSLAPRDICSR